MISIKTFIKLNDEFIDIFNLNEKIKNNDYIDGAIELTINGKVLMDKSMYDYIDDFWSYLSEGLYIVSQEKEFKCFFPDQPIEVNFIPQKENRILVSVNCHEEIKTFVDKSEFLHVMTEHAKKFFEKLEDLNSASMGTRKSALQFLDKINL
ncbi:hypothetical protein KTP48_03595 [Proteus mirabilis]|uniref:hypothetical protein n=1 Tax=Proteus mirabilis TaxID=584 RepID=UPI001C2C2ADA|nr:hypothetical protein [Proteus mirabilis]MBU9977827.1 hypothetical protein [Proteus mirabilis]